MSGTARIIYVIAVLASLKVISDGVAFVGWPPVPFVIAYSGFLLFCWLCLYVHGVHNSLKGRRALEAHRNVLDDIYHMGKSKDKPKVEASPLITEIEYKTWLNLWLVKISEIRFFEETQIMVGFHVIVFGRRRLEVVFPCKNR